MVCVKFFDKRDVEFDCRARQHIRHVTLHQNIAVLVDCIGYFARSNGTGARLYVEFANTTFNELRSESVFLLQPYVSAAASIDPSAMTFFMFNAKEKKDCGPVEYDPSRQGEIFKGQAN